jgi:Protein of unknwon function (DUF3310)
MSANDKQIAGNHYKQFTNYEPWDVVTAWGLGYLDGTALKYIARWKHKNGIEDIRKAIHFLEKLIEVELANPTRDVAMEQRPHLVPIANNEHERDAHPRFGSLDSFTQAARSTNLNTLEIIRPDSNGTY